MDILDKIVKIITKKEAYGLIIIVVASLIVYNIGRLIISKIVVKGKNSYDIKRRKTVVSIIENLYKYFLLVIMVIFILNLYGINVKSLVAGVGIAGALVGLALQDTLKDLIAGIAIILENYYVVGDYVEIEGFTGKVIEYGLKSTKIMDFSGNVLVIANRNIQKIVNISQKKANLIIGISTAYEEKTEKVEKVITNMLDDIKDIDGVGQDIRYIGISDLGASAVVYTILVECNQEKQWQVKRDILRLIKNTYDKNNLKIPYTQVEVHNGQDI